MKPIVIYFSVGGTTANIAKAFAESTGSDIFEIVPENPYTASDIKWINPLARCNKEKLGKKDVPVVGSIDNFTDYSAYFIGFPIWYGCAPNVVNTFCKGYDWSGRKVCLFATSAGSGIGKTAEKLRPHMSGADIAGAKLVKSAEELESWAKSVLEFR